MSASARRERLRGGAKHLFEFAAEMRFISKFKSAGRHLVAAALGYQVTRQPALQVPKPAAGGTRQIVSEKALQLALGDGTQSSHLGGIEIRLPGQRFPLFQCQQVCAHFSTVQLLFYPHSSS